VRTAQSIKFILLMFCKFQVNCSLSKLRVCHQAEIWITKTEDESNSSAHWSSVNITCTLVRKFRS